MIHSMGLGLGLGLGLAKALTCRPHEGAAIQEALWHD